MGANDFLHKLTEYWQYLCDVEVIEVEQGWGHLMCGRDVEGNPLCIAGTKFDRGFGTHAKSRIRIVAARPLVHFSACAGIADNAFVRTNAEYTGNMIFSVEADGVVLASASVVFGEKAVIDADLPGVTEFDLVAEADFSFCAHANWGAPELVTADGSVIYPGEIDELRKAFPAGTPVDFVYNGMGSADFIAQNGLKHIVEEDRSFFRHVYTCSSRELIFELVCLEYKEFPVLEWHVRFFRPAGSAVGGVLSDVKSVLWNNPYLKGRFRFRRYHGSIEALAESYPDSFHDSFLPVECEAEEGARWHFSATSGRPSAQWMPFFDVENDNVFWRFAVGWAGQWECNAAFENGIFQAGIGMEKFAAALEEGEELNFPSILMMRCCGSDFDKSVNIWRRFFRTHIMQNACAPLSVMTWGGVPKDMHRQKIAMIREKSLPFEVYWVDAGWFGPPSVSEHEPVWVKTVGNWKHHPETVPGGFAEVADAVHEAGMKFLLWFEPERARRGSMNEQEKNDFFISDESENCLLDLGDNEAWEYCFNSHVKLIREYKIDWIRFDFNISPLSYWRKKDVPGRIGVCEVKYVAGLYRFWRRLREEFPGLRIDNCASGGRRLDFELLRFSVPLWYSDMQCFENFDPQMVLTQIAGLSSYLPVFACGTQNKQGGDTYNFRVSMANGLAVHWFYNNEFSFDSYPHTWLRERLLEFLQVRECFAGDIYWLSAPEPSCRNMAVMQYYLPECGKGIIVVARDGKCPEFARIIKLQGLKQETIYRIWDDDGEIKQVVMTGKQLAEEGVVVKIDKPRTALLIHYCIVQ